MRSGVGHTRSETDVGVDDAVADQVDRAFGLTF